MDALLCMAASDVSLCWSPMQVASLVQVLQQRSGSWQAWLTTPTGLLLAGAGLLWGVIWARRGTSSS